MNAYAGDLSPRESWDLLRQDEAAVLIDVRTDAEWAYVGRADLSELERDVRFIPWLNFPQSKLNEKFVEQVDALGLAKDKPLLLLCRSGVRSRHAAAALTAAGYGPCYNVAEGFEGDKDKESHRGTLGGWKMAGLPWVQD